ncbi:hypothetical protein M9458_029060, partial [Cirrhinus mrigala]
EGPPLSGEGHNLAPVARSLEAPSLVPGQRGLQQSSIHSGKHPYAGQGPLY